MAREQKFNLIYAGAIKVGHTEAQVKESFIDKLNVPEDKVERLFSGKPITLHKSLSKSKAEAWQHKLMMIGAEVAIIPAVDMQAKSSEKESNKEEKIPESKVDIVSNPLIKNSKLNSNHEDQALQEKIDQAKAMIAAQQVEKPLASSNETNSYSRLITFILVMTAVLIFLYYHVGSFT